MRKLSWLATALIAVPGLSYAQAGGEDFFGKHDKDGDGKVTLAEIEAVAQAQLEAADANHDGILSVEELNAARTQERFSALDKDQSGGVNLEEFQAQTGGRGMRGGMRGGMGGRDEDGDGNISVAELTSGAKRMFERADADQDGALTPEELQAARPQRRGPGGQGAEGQGPGAEGEGRGRRGRGGRGGPGGQGGQGGGAWAEEAFKRLDADNSGELSLEELQAAQNQRGGRGEGRGGRGGRGRGGRGGSDREI